MGTMIWCSFVIVTKCNCTVLLQYYTYKFKIKPSSRLIIIKTIHVPYNNNKNDGNFRNIYNKKFFWFWIFQKQKWKKIFNVFKYAKINV